MSGFSGSSTNLATQRVLFNLLSANMNTTADQAFTKLGAFTNYNITSIIVTNVSTSLTLAAGGIYGAASKSVPIIVAAAQVYSGLTGATVILNPTIAAGGLALLSASGLFLSLTTGQGGAATADFYICGYALN